MHFEVSSQFLFCQLNNAFRKQYTYGKTWGNSLKTRKVFFIGCNNRLEMLVSALHCRQTNKEDWLFELYHHISCKYHTCRPASAGITSTFQYYKVFLTIMSYSMTSLSCDVAMGY